jgi:hypothetical protein
MHTQDFLRRMEISPPEEFICPFTLGIFEDPVCTADGHSYERKDIEEWLFTKNQDTSPKTGAKLGKDGEPDRSLRPNHALRQAIETWKQTMLESQRFISCSELRLNLSGLPLDSMADTEKQSFPIYSVNLRREHKRVAEIGIGPNKIVYRGIWKDRNVAILHVRRGIRARDANAYEHVSTNERVAAYYGMCLWEDGSQHIVTELAPMGSLDVVVEQSIHGVGPFIARKIFHQVMTQVYVCVCVCVCVFVWGYHIHAGTEASLRIRVCLKRNCVLRVCF